MGAQEPRGNKYTYYIDDCHEGTLQFAVRALVTLQFAVRALVEVTLTKGNHLAKADDRVGQPCRVAYEQVEEPAY